MIQLKLAGSVAKTEVTGITQIDYLELQLSNCCRPSLISNVATFFVKIYGWIFSWAATRGQHDHILLS